MKKLITIIMIMSVVLATLVAGGQGEGSVKNYSLGTGSIGGNYYLVGGGIANLINNELPETFLITSEETGGSYANLALIESGEAEIGIALTSAINEGLTGKAAFTNGIPMKNVRGLIPLYPSFFTSYTLKSSPINCLDDFDGKIVGTGTRGAGQDVIFREVFEDRGIKPASIFNDGFATTATAISDGQIDVALLFSYPPFAAITELEATKSLKFIGLTAEEQDYMVERYPFYSKSTIPAGSYKGITEDIPAISEWNMLVVAASLSTDEVYLITKTLFENSDALVNIHASLINAIPENELNFNLPLHPGVIKYLEEVGIEVPERLIPQE